MSVGHGSGIIEKSWTDELIGLLLEYVRFDHGYNIPLGGGSSVDGSPIYGDKSIPMEYVQKNGKKVAVWHYLMVHEFVEKAIIDALLKHGVPDDKVYTPGHAVGTAAELAAAEDDGVNIDEYDGFYDHWLPVAEKKKLGDGTPPDLDLHAYEDA